MFLLNKHQTNKFKTNPKHIYYVFGVSYGLILAAIGIHILLTSHAVTPLGSGAPSTPPVQICNNSSILSGPTTAPTGAITLPAGDNSNMSASYQLSPNTVYWFAPGTHTLGTSQYAQFQPDSGDTFIGAPGAILNGQGLNQSAFTGTSPNVTIKYLTVEGFNAPEGQMVINHDGGAGWVVEYNTVENNGGAGVGMATNSVVSNNCLTNNTEYGFSSFGTSTNITLTNNEISYNDSGGQYDHGGSSISCGCSGGGKFWDTTDSVVTNNYVHDNGNVGIWVDTDNAGFNISNNYISNNYAEGVIYEISYNAQIINNTFIGNALGAGPTLGGFPDSALYISESGSDSRVNTPYNTQFLVSGNVFTNNWGGVVLWENSNRHCSDGGMDNYCTLVNPSTYTIASCGANLAETSPIDYFDNCRWKTQNVLITNNQFNLNPAAIGTNCTPANFCGFNALFSDYGNSPYTGSIVPINITFNQNNLFTNNNYTGPWNFFAWSQGNLDNPTSFATWSAPVTDKCSTTQEKQSGTCNSGFGQDAGSTFNGAGNSAPSTSITLPVSSAIVHGDNVSVTATAAASGSATIAKVSLDINGATYATDTSQPYNFNWNSLSSGYPNGFYNLTTVATDTNGISTTSSSITVKLNNGDVNGDGTVNISDLSILASNWGKTFGTVGKDQGSQTTFSEGDLNEDNTVSITDLSILATNWGTTD